MEEVIHRHVDQKYRVVIERVGSSREGILGYKIEANGDNLEDTVLNAQLLKQKVEEATK